MFSEPFIFADDLKILAVQRGYCEVRDDLHGIENWVIQNKTELAIDKCAYLKFRVRDQQYKLMGKDLAETAKAADISWQQHIDERMKKANRVLYMLMRNVAIKIKHVCEIAIT